MRFTLYAYYQFVNNRQKDEHLPMTPYIIWEAPTKLYLAPRVRAWCTPVIKRSPRLRIGITSRSTARLISLWMGRISTYGAIRMNCSAPSSKPPDQFKSQRFVRDGRKILLVVLHHGNLSGHDAVLPAW